MTTLTSAQAALEEAAQARSTPRAHRWIPRALSVGSHLIPPAPEYVAQYDNWRTIRDCLAGEKTIKANGTRYLLSPKNLEGDYETYKDRAYWYNAVRITRRSLLGAMMRKNPEVTLPAALSPFISLSSFTIDGRTFVELVRETCSEQLTTSFCGLLADLPADPDPSRPPAPYATFYPAESVFSWRWTKHRGRRVIDRVVLLEDVTINTEYATETRQGQRILRLDPAPDSDDLVYSQDFLDPFTNDLVHVPVNVRGRRLNYMPFEFVTPQALAPSPTEPLLLDLANVNLSHYGSTALLEHALFYAGMPTYWLSGKGNGADQFAEGLGTPNPMSVCPSNLWLLEEGDKCGLIEFNGHGLSFLENSVDSKQAQMQSMGGKLIPAQRTAPALSTEAYALMESGDEATLLDVALSVESALTRIIRAMADLADRPLSADDTSVLVELNKEFIKSDLTAREISALRTLYESRMIPLDVMYYALRQVNVIPMEYTLEQFRTLMETPSQLYPDPKVQPIPGGPIYNPADPRDPRNRPAPPSSRPPANSGTGD